MALNGLTFDPIQAYGKELKLLTVKWTCITGGAVGTISGKGFFASSGSNPATAGSVVENGTGGFTVTLPGSGSIHDLFVLGVSYVGADDDVTIKVDSYDLATRTLEVQTLTNASTPALQDVTTGEVHLILLVKNTDVG
jgi:hypothetical protein